MIFKKQIHKFPGSQDRNPSTKLAVALGNFLFDVIFAVNYDTGL